MRFASFIRRLVLAAATVTTCLAAAPVLAGPVADRVKATGVLRVCIWPDYYGITFRNPRTNQLAGIDIDLSGELAHDLGVQLRHVDSSFATLIVGGQNSTKTRASFEKASHHLGASYTDMAPSFLGCSATKALHSNALRRSKLAAFTCKRFVRPRSREVRLGSESRPPQAIAPRTSPPFSAPCARSWWRRESRHRERHGHGNRQDAPVASALARTGRTRSDDRVETRRVRDSGRRGERPEAPLESNTQARTKGFVATWGARCTEGAPFAASRGGARGA